MTIQVRSSSDPLTPVSASAAPAEDAVKALPTDEQKTAPEATKEPLEQKTEDSETSPVEAKHDVEVDSTEEESVDDSDKEDETEKTKPKKKSGFQRRIDKLNQAKAEAQRETEYWKRQALENANAPKKESIESKPAAADGKPKPEAFETHAEYVEALTDWKTEQKLNERDQKREKISLEIEQNKLTQAYNDRVKAFSAKYEDFHDALEQVDDIPLSPIHQQLIISSESGPELAYKLAKNRELFEKFSKLSPIAASRELGRIEATLAPASTTKVDTKKITTAPKPIQPVGGGKGSAGISIYDPKISQADYEKLRAEQIKQRRQA